MAKRQLDYVLVRKKRQKQNIEGRSVQLVLRPRIKSSSGEHEESSRPAGPQVSDNVTSV